MKRLIFLAMLAVAAVAQTALSPQRIDWRYRFTWDDPNSPGTVASWTIYASNNIVVRSTTVRGLTLDLLPLLNGSPAGTYALFGVPVSQLGDVGEASTNLFVIWPGGNGKIKGPVNGQVGK